MSVGSDSTRASGPIPPSPLSPFLSVDPEALRAWERSAFDAQAAPFSKDLVLHGAGNMGRSILKGLRARGLEPLAFSDSNPRLWGREIGGLPVLPPQEAAGIYGSRAAFVVTIWNRDHCFPETLGVLEGAGCRRVVSCAALFYKYPETFLPYYSLDLPSRILGRPGDVALAFEQMADDESRREFINELRFRMGLDFGLPVTRTLSEQHFPTDLLKLGEEEVFFDCGAYDGDTLERFLLLCQGRFAEALAFEPDPGNFERLKACVESLPEDIRSRIRCIGAAVGAEAGRIRFGACGTESSSASSEGEVSVDCVALDSLVGQVTPTYIKMDIEGAEMKALQGARVMIQRTRPTLAVCVYHRPDHLWEVPLALVNLCPEYRLYLRRYAQFPWDVVCYALPAKDRAAP